MGIFKINTPAKQVIRAGCVTGNLTFDSRLASRTENNLEQAQKFIDSECIKRMSTYTPRRTGVLIKSATIGTVIGSGEIHQQTPYARRQYYEHKSKGKWFERMKNNHKDSILRGAKTYVR